VAAAVVVVAVALDFLSTFCKMFFDKSKCDVCSAMFFCSPYREAPENLPKTKKRTKK
jgi:hypothetical protein